MNNKNLWLHIGNFKTGTTSIQHACLSKDFDYYYPRLNDTHYHGEFAWKMFNDQSGDFGSNTRLNEMVDIIKSSENENTLLSLETLSRVIDQENGQVALSFIKNTFSDYNINIVFYIREPDSMMYSWYNQVNKEAKQGQGSKNFLQFINNRSSSIYSQLSIYEMYANFFGEENVIVRPFILKGDEHINDFYATIGSQYRVDNFQAKNLKVDDDNIELLRISKFGGTVSNSVTHSGLNISDLNGKVEKINKDFSLLLEKTNLVSVMDSKLSLESICTRHLKLVSLCPVMYRAEKNFIKNQLLPLVNDADFVSDFLQNFNEW